MEIRNINDLVLLDSNPRTINREDFERLKTSLKSNKDYSKARPVILSNRTGKLVVIGGNQRVRAYKELGIENIPTYLLEGLTEERERDYY